MLLNIQALRAIAALFVVFVHLDRLAQLTGLPKGTTEFGNAGVDLFFVISGVVMVVTTSEHTQTTSQFLRRRIARIVPLYWLITLAVCALALIDPALLQSTKPEPAGLIKSLAFIPYSRLDGQMHPIVFVGWTLNYEMIFYAIFALGMLFSRRAFGFAFALVVLGLAALAGQTLHPRDPILAFYTSPIILEFGGGMLLGILFTRGRLPTMRIPFIVTGAIAFIAILAGPLLWPAVDRSLAAGIPALLIVGSAVMAERAGLVCRSRWIFLLGAASYAIYLTHFFVTQAIVKIADRAGSLSLGEGFACWLAAMALVIGAGMAVHWIAELPLTALTRRLLEGRGRLPAVAPAVSSNTTAINEGQVAGLPEPGTAI